MGRLRYEGDWSKGVKTGIGRVDFRSGDRYEGGFSEGVPHGEGVFTYADGMRESGAWEEGLRHGRCRFNSVGGTEEEVRESRKSHFEDYFVVDLHFCRLQYFNCCK